MTDCICVLCALLFSIVHSTFTIHHVTPCFSISGHPSLALWALMGPWYFRGWFMYFIISSEKTNMVWYGILFANDIVPLSQGQLHSYVVLFVQMTCNK